MRAGVVYRQEDYIYSIAADYRMGKQAGKVKVALLGAIQTTNT